MPTTLTTPIIQEYRDAHDRWVGATDEGEKTAAKEGRDRLFSEIVSMMSTELHKVATKTHYAAKKREAHVGVDEFLNEAYAALHDVLITEGDPRYLMRRFRNKFIDRSMKLTGERLPTLGFKQDIRRSRKVYQARTEVEQLGIEPTVEAIAAHDTDLPKTLIERVLNPTYCESLSDDHDVYGTASAEDVAVAAASVEDIHAAIDALCTTPIDRLIIYRRFGLDGHRPATFGDLAEMTGKTDHQCRHVVDKFKGLLSHPANPINVNLIAD